MFGAAFGGHGWGATSPKRSIRRGLRNALGDVTEDALRPPTPTIEHHHVRFVVSGPPDGSQMNPQAHSFLSSLTSLRPIFSLPNALDSRPPSPAHTPMPGHVSSQLL
jgi:hypothetical protein